MHSTIPNKTDVQNMLKALMKVGFTEDALACGLSVSQSTVSKLIHGKTIPRIDMAARIDEIFRRFGPVGSD